MAKKEKEQVGSVKVVVRDPEAGNVVKRIPVYLGDDPERVAADARAKANATRS